MPPKRITSNNLAYQRKVPKFLKEIIQKTGYQGDEESVENKFISSEGPSGDHHRKPVDDLPTVVVLDEKKNLSLAEAKAEMASGARVVGDALQDVQPVATAQTGKLTLMAVLV
jgi:hypothetical protein